jgi:hypothetical protein
LQSYLFLLQSYLFLLKNYHFRRKITIFVANQRQRNVHFYSSTVAQAAVEE